MKLSIFKVSNPDSVVLVTDKDEARVINGHQIFDQLFKSENPGEWLGEQFEKAEPIVFKPSKRLLPPIGNQEVWAAGVTYFRSKSARMEEAEVSGGDIFYDKVYDAERPEIFFKATAPRVKGPEEKIGIRKDSTWDVPEPELTLAINQSGKIFGYTIGNDVSSRSIEGENPLYLPQAKVYTASCAMGPCLVVDDQPGKDVNIRVEISRSGEIQFSGETEVGQIKRGLDELAEFLFRSNDFPLGAYLMTGTGIVPDSDFTLQAGDRVAITIDGVGTLSNEVEVV